MEKVGLTKSPTVQDTFGVTGEMGIECITDKPDCSKTELASWCECEVQLSAKD